MVSEAVGEEAAGSEKGSGLSLKGGRVGMECTSSSWSGRHSSAAVSLPLLSFLEWKQ